MSGGEAGELDLLDGPGERLRGENADHGTVFDDGDELAGTERGSAAESLHELVGGAGELEAAGHDALEVAVAVDEEALGDGLAGDGADEAIAAYDGEDVLTAVRGAVERTLEGVGAGEQGVFGEHDVADGGVIRRTQSAFVLEDAIGQLINSNGSSSSGGSGSGNGAASGDQGKGLK